MRRASWARGVLLVALLVGGAALGSCGTIGALVPGLVGSASEPGARGGDAERGRQAIVAYGCGACHVIPGVTGARGAVGPPLGGVGSRAIIAGRRPNTPENVARWIEDPPALAPGTAMPNLGVTAADAQDIAAYLRTLR